MKLECENPLIAYQVGYHINERGQKVKSIMFDAFAARSCFLSDEEFEKSQLKLPCGHCAVCRKNKRKEMTVRLTNEIESNEQSSFLTLTYKTEELPYVNVKTGEIKRYKELKKIMDDFFYEESYVLKDWNPTLLKSDLQNFIKRLRKHLSTKVKKDSTKEGRDYVENIRYFAVGEYGVKKQRPHWHVIIFGWIPSDLEVFANRGQYNLYRSKQVEKCWTEGISIVGECNNAVAKYCAQYVTKKEDKSIIYPPFVQKELVLCSKMNGAIGATYCDKYWKQILDQNGVGMLNRKTGKLYKYRIPSYYKARIARKHPEEFQEYLDEQDQFIVECIKNEEGMSPVLAKELLVEQHRLLKYYAELEARKEKLRTYESDDKQFDKYAVFVKYLNTT